MAKSLKENYLTAASEYIKACYPPQSQEKMLAKIESYTDLPTGLHIIGSFLSDHQKEINNALKKDVPQLGPRRLVTIFHNCPKSKIGFFPMWDEVLCLAIEKPGLITAPTITVQNLRSWIRSWSTCDLENIRNAGDNFRYFQRAYREEAMQERLSKR